MKKQFETIAVNIRTNSLGQPIGPPVRNWTLPCPPKGETMAGELCRLERLAPDQHARGLYDANKLDAEGRNWTYLPYGPFPTFAEYREWVEAVSAGDDPLFYAIVDQQTGQPGGVASYLRITPTMGTIEVGHIHFSPLLQRTTAATEAMYLMMKNAFALGYRRYEWKCDALNAPSRAGAQRLGFSFEGVFRQASVYKNRSRDAAWYSVIDREWPALEAAFFRWLAHSNFDASAKQRLRLADLTRPLLHRCG